MAVVKVGGSLLTFAGIAPALRAWLSVQSPEPRVLVVGGGQLADAIRQLDRVHMIGDRLGHRLCVDLLAISARVLAHLLPEYPFVERWAALPHALACQPRAVILNVTDFLGNRGGGSRQDLLPESWETTTDSIAACLAHALGDGRLDLLKSTDLPRGIDWHSASRQQYVDQSFPAASAGLDVYWWNLRSSAVQTG